MATVDVPTGLAVITVDPEDVSIVVAAGANASLDADGVQTAAAEIAAADALLLQGEVSARRGPRRSGDRAPDTSVIVVLNPAPFNDVAPAVLPLADVVIVNRAEAEQLHQSNSGGSAAELRPDVVLVETRGAAGCVVRASRTVPPSLRTRDSDGIGEHINVPAPQVAVVDATGAGDAFAGAFAVGMASGAGPHAAAQFAVRAGAWAVGVAGAQPSLPMMAQLRGFEDVAAQARP